MLLKLASGSYDGTVRFWNPTTGNNIANETINLNKVNGIPNRIEISDDKSKLIVGMNNCMKIYDLAHSDTVLRSFDNCFKGNVTAVGFRKQDRCVYTAC